MHNTGQLKIVVVSIVVVSSLVMQGEKSVAKQRLKVPEPLPAFCGRLQSSWDYFVSVFFPFDGRRRRHIPESTASPVGMTTVTREMNNSEKTFPLYGTRRNLWNIAQSMERRGK